MGHMPSFMIYSLLVLIPLRFAESMKRNTFRTSFHYLKGQTFTEEKQNLLIQVFFRCILTMI